MLTQIHIRDFATIEALQLYLKHGNTMITGVTGAGKSIFIEAIELALGGRASATIIRPGKDRADITLCFDITNFPYAIALLKQLDLYQDSAECLIRRVITSDGRSRSYVNGLPATLQWVKELGEMLFHLHGQHEQHVLLKAETQREMLDRYGYLLELAAQVQAYAEEWKSVEQQIHSLRTQTKEHADRYHYLRFQLDELEAVNLKPGEWTELESEHKRLAHAEELLHHVQSAIQLMTENDAQNILALLKETRKTLETIQALEPKTTEWIHTVHSSVIQLTDLESDLKNYLANTELDPEKLQQIEARMGQIFNLARKHKISPPELLEFKEQLMTELNLLNSSDQSLSDLIQKQQLIAQQYAEQAQRLSLRRKEAAAKLEQEISTTIRSLSLPHAEFKIDLEKTPASFSPHGQEKIVFLIKTNPGQSLQPLAKAISGGELSRLSLAAHLALTHKTTVPTLVFDEVDTGLSGAMAEKIGKLLRKLGNSYQVFCITHQAQVAAFGHHHLLVEKYFVEQTTHTRLRLLDDEEKASEIARMLGGEKITEKTRAHAQEILYTSNSQPE